MKDEIRKIIHEDIEQMNANLLRFDRDRIDTIQTCINYAFELLDKIKLIKEEE